MPRRKKENQHSDQITASSAAAASAEAVDGNTTIYDDILSFTNPGQNSELVCLPNHAIQYYMRKNGRIVDRGSLSEENTVSIPFGCEVAFIPHNGGKIVKSVNTKQNKGK